MSTYLLSICLLFQEIKSGSRSIAVERLALTSRQLDALAEALREAAGKLREKQSYSLAGIIEMGSESAMRVSNKLRESSPETITGAVEDFARRRPGVFLGAAVVTGILLGQLFSSSGEQQGTVQEFHPRKETSLQQTKEKAGHVIEAARDAAREEAERQNLLPH